MEAYKTKMTIKNKQQVIYFFDWLDTPKEEREPRTQIQYAEKVGVATITLRRWRDNRSRYEKEFGLVPLAGYRPAVQNLGDILDRNELVILARKFAEEGDHDKMIELSKRILFLMGIEKGRRGEITDYLKSKGEMIDKRDETHRYEFTEDAEERIAKRLFELQEEAKREEALITDGGGGAGSEEDTLQE